MSSFTIKRVEFDHEIAGIRHLQEINLRRNLSDSEAESQGFVTAEYSIEFLTLMHQISPSVIAVSSEGSVVGYIIVTTKDIRDQHKLLGEFFDELDLLSYKNKSLKDLNYVLCGQLCVAKEFRGLGVVPKMYTHFRTSLENQFDYCTTDVVDTNMRSIHAHLKVGFQQLCTVNYSGENWTILLWDWAESNASEEKKERNNN